MATSVEPCGIARVFFDMRAAAQSFEDERHIALAIERACALAAPNSEASRDRRRAPADPER